MNYLSVCAVYRNEGPYLREWIEFHRLVGVERIYLYNNRSTDDHREAVAPYADDGFVVAHEWPDVLPPNVVVGEAAQCAVYQDCILRHGGETRWIAFIDLDEFLFSPTGTALPDMLHEYERWPGVGVNWAQYGTSGHRTRPDGLVIENFVRRADARGYNRPIKCIVDPRRVRSFCLAHFFMFHGEPQVVVDENHQPVTGLSRTDEVSFAKLRLNHYATKSEEEYRERLKRVRVDNGLPRDFSEQQIARMMKVTNAVEDRTIQMHLPALKEALAERQPV
jgi:Glycosyltransferase family 92